MSRSHRPVGSVPATASAKAILSRHGKSFHWAGQLMGRTNFDDAAILYAFCREVDDAVDLASTPAQARRAIAQIRTALCADQPSLPAVTAYQALAERHRLHPKLARDLIDGVAGDIGPVSIETRHQLLQYCYRVAGTVGAMMCPILGVNDPRALPFAIDLGIAMQLTNIARDVAEDARQGRLYLPQEALPIPITAAELLQATPGQRLAVTAAVLRLLQLAECYYRSADQGMRFIPLPNRLAIVTVARLYRAIGLKIMHAPAQIWQRRVMVHAPEKALRSVVALIECLCRPTLLGLNEAVPHHWPLHNALEGLWPT